jgi:hypothetical protein
VLALVVDVALKQRLDAECLIRPSNCAQLEASGEILAREELAEVGVVEEAVRRVEGPPGVVETDGEMAANHEVDVGIQTDSLPRRDIVA